MIRCGRCCLHKWMRGVNMFVNLCGVAMIIYSLWLLKKWELGVAVLPNVSYIPRPWFIYTCLGVGIAVCLSTLCGHMVANCMNDYILCIYTLSIFALLLIEVALVVTIYFRMNWEVQFSKYIDENHEDFRSFVMFHLIMCRLIVITALVPQINVIIVAIILWGIGTAPRAHCNYSAVPDFRRSFLVIPHSPITDTARIKNQ
ncbi:tetraspanin-19-like isoform X2 [Ziziphus jujuba]|uniref:Tetraspanin-19-like isoform X2 n=1 Tax=Ziziphus jujuba TaxID=326968 RepID=A0ABM4A8T6_ZIZJJ|nr:tetraspanin-19-like isoform X2 [Ziziphus jujuba]